MALQGFQVGGRSREGVLRTLKMHRYVVRLDMRYALMYVIELVHVHVGCLWDFCGIPSFENFHWCPVGGRTGMLRVHRTLTSCT